jgi:hypothetical protein
MLLLLAIEVATEALQSILISVVQILTGLIIDDSPPSSPPQLAAAAEAAAEEEEDADDEGNLTNFILNDFLEITKLLIYLLSSDNVSEKVPPSFT